MTGCPYALTRFNDRTVRHMGIFIDYNYQVECPEADLVERMGRLREKLLGLPFDSVSPVIAVEPVYQPLYLRMLSEHGGTIPECVQERITNLTEVHHDWCHMVAPPVFMHLPKETKERFFRPAFDFCKTTKLWRPEDLPEQISDGICLKLYRFAFELEFASVMLRRGHLIVVQPCEGCETFSIGLSSFCGEDNALWLGGGFSKTMYATRFVQAHESICTALDFAQGEGLLQSASDTCGFYDHRDWSRSADIVNTETTATKAICDAIRIGIETAQKNGVNIQDVSSPAMRNYNLVQVEPKTSRG
jgi:hypothetical protein